MCDSFQHRQMVKARKPHQCESCRRWVPAGERYVAMAGKWDGDFYATKLCQGCESLWELIWAFDGEHGGWLDDGIAFHQIMEVGEEFGLVCYVPATGSVPAAASIASTA